MTKTGASTLTDLVSSPLKSREETKVNRGFTRASCKCRANYTKGFIKTGPVPVLVFLQGLGEKGVPELRECCRARPKWSGKQQ